MDSSRREIAEATITAFRDRFGRAPERMAVCPGRVNLIGEHTDYSGGFVLPAAIPLYTAVAVGPGTEGRITLHSTRFGEQEIPTGPMHPVGGFATYLAGAIAEAGLSDTPLHVVIHGDMPVAAGLSSSASLLVAALAALGTGSEPQSSDLAETTPGTEERLALAKAARRVENDFVGVPCGFMDQFAVAMGRQDHALLLDCRDNSWRTVPARLPDHEWVVIYSGLQRELAEGGYKTKVEAVQGALAVLDNHLGDPGAASHLLRTHPPGRVPALARDGGVCEAHWPLLEHVCTENARVHLMRAALESADARTVGTLLGLGHDSLSRLFGVSLPAIDHFVERGRRVVGVTGIRLTGAGMGGSLVGLVEREHLMPACQELADLARAELHPAGQVYPLDGLVDGVERWKL